MTLTGEYYAEKLASEIGKLINVKCADVDIGVFDGRIGSMSYNFIDDNFILIEGVNFITKKYPLYDKDLLEDIILY